VLRWGPYPFLRIAIFFGAGILSYVQAGRKPGFIFPLLAGLFLFYGLAWWLAASRRSTAWNNAAGLAGLAAIGLLGFLTAHYRTARVRPDNLVHQPGPVSYYVGVVDEYVSQKPASQVTILALRRVQVAGRWRAASGRVRLVLVKRKGAHTPGYGDVLLVKGAPAPVPPPGNPYQFDYRLYLSRQQVYHQHYRYPGQYVLIGSDPANPLVAASIHTRNYFDRQLRRYIPPAREYGIATALVLGIKDYLPDDLKATYVNTGTMHVLAVSGLHVALLFYVLQLLLGRWGQGRGMRLGAFVVMLAVIWFYAFVTALSASVLRAVVMFSFIQAATAFRLPSNIYNTLAAAAFGLLLFNPYLLVDVGFQLSFLAVYGIVYFQPRIYRWLACTSFAGDYLWKLVSTSLAAQLAVLPLSFYYFHQFPVYFLPANIVAVTLSNGALLLGFLLLALAWLPAVAQWLGLGILWLLQGMNYVSEALVRLPGSQVTGIVLSQGQAWLMYALMALLTLFLVRRKLPYFAVFTGLLLLFAVQEVAQARGRQKQGLLVVYQVRGATALGFIRERGAALLADSAFYAGPRHHQYLVQPHWWQLGINRVRRDTLQARALPGAAFRTLSDGNVLLSWRGIRVLVCRKPLGNYPLAQAGLDYLVLTRNVKISPEILPNKKGRLVVIIDGSNKAWYEEKWQAALRARQVNVYLVSRQGAYIREVH
jgi:competence protein ComEC